MEKVSLVLLLCMFAGLSSVIALSSEEGSSASKMMGNKEQERKQTKSSRSSRFLPFNTKGLFPSSGSQQSFLNQIRDMYGAAKPSDDDLAGRFFKIMSTPSGFGMDQSQALLATLNANIPRIADAYASIADSLETISSEWEIQLSEMILMQIVQALEEIAASSMAPATMEAGGGMTPRRRG